MIGEDDADDDVLMSAERAADANAVTFANQSMRLGTLAVDLDLAALAGTLGLRACLAETADVEPDVDASGVAQGGVAQMRISTLPFAASALTKAWVCS